MIERKTIVDEMELLPPLGKEKQKMKVERRVSVEKGGAIQWNNIWFDPMVFMVIGFLLGAITTNYLGAM